jgi:hypothetical protein
LQGKGWIYEAISLLKPVHNRAAEETAQKVKQRPTNCSQL